MLLLAAHFFLPLLLHALLIQLLLAFLLLRPLLLLAAHFLPLLLHALLIQLLLAFLLCARCCCWRLISSCRCCCTRC